MKKLIAVLFCLAILSSCFVSCGKKGNTIIVAASTTPHAEILEQCVSILAEKGYTLEIRRMDDYVIPNNATEDGEVDANYFQHVPYLDTFNAEHGTHLVSVGKIHYEPYAIYAGKTKSLSELPDGAKIAIPNDGSNEARALFLLEANGLIKLKENVGMTATKKDIAENPHNYDIVEMEAALIPGVLSDMEIAIINGNYAIGAGLKVSQSLAKEDAASIAAQTYANILVVKKGNENSEKTLALLEALQSQKVKDFINATYDSAVVPIF